MSTRLSIQIPDEMYAAIKRIASESFAKPNEVIRSLLRNAIMQHEAGINPLLASGSRAAVSAIPKRPVGRPPLPPLKDVTISSEPDRIIIAGVPQKEVIPEHVVRKFVKYTTHLPIRIVPIDERPIPDCEYQDTAGHWFCEGVPIHPKGDYPLIDSTSDNPRRIYPVWWDSVYGEGSRQKMVDLMFEAVEQRAAGGNEGARIKLARWYEENRRVDFDPTGEERLQELNREHLEELTKGGE